VFNATFSNISAISWRPVLVVEEAGENHRPLASTLFKVKAADLQVSYDIIVEIYQKGDDSKQMFLQHAKILI
jgi:hypothetical protein